MIELAAVLTVMLGAFVQGASGLGFALVAAPVMSQIFVGAPGIGLVVALGTLQALLITARTKATIRYDVLRQITPLLAIGTVVGLALNVIGVDRVRTPIVLVSAITSVAWLIAEPRVRIGGVQHVLPVWGGVVNAMSGVGGPPISSFLIRRISDHESFIRTQQLAFAAINLIAIPSLGIAMPSVGFAVFALGALAGGSLLGTRMRVTMGPALGRRIAFGAIAMTSALSVLLTIR